MKILMVLLRHEGGVGRVIETLKNEFIKCGHNVETISREDDLECFSLLKSFKVLRKEVSKIYYDVIITNDWSISLPLLKQKNHISIFHGMDTLKISNLLQRFTGIILGNKLISVGDGVHKVFKKSNKVYNGISKEIFFNMNKKRKYLGWIKRDYELITEEQVSRIAKEKGLELSIAEKIPSNKMNEWYNSLDTFISLPPSYTGFNLCWVEAYLSGVPNIIGNDNGVGIRNIKDTKFRSNIQAKKIMSIITQFTRKVKHD